MSKHALMLFLLALLVVSGILLLRSCGDASRSEATNDAAAVQPVAGDADAGAKARSDAEARALAVSRQREEALYAAVSTLHRYLAALPGEDRAKADAFWANKSAPAVSTESDLRSLKDLRSLRIENGTPKSLDAEAVPNAVEIPVSLSASRKGQPLQRYRGWYRLRRAVADGSWEITSASIEAIQR